MSKTVQYYSVKSVLPIVELSSVRLWLLANCGRRWHATNFKNQLINWRVIRKNTTEPLINDLLGNLDYTVHFHFKNRNDMMLFLLSWPGEVLINSANDSKISCKADK